MEDISLGAGGGGQEFTTHFGPGERKIHLLSVT